MNFKFLFFIIPFLSFLLSCKNDSTKVSPGPKNISLLSVSLDGRPFSYSYSGTSITPQIVLGFSEPIDHTSAQNSILLNNGVVPVTISFTHHDSSLVVQPVNPLNYLTGYSLLVSPQLTSATKKTFGISGITIKLMTGVNPVPKFPVISDTALVTLVQQQTLKYFYDFAEPVSGMARERNSSGNTVTMGGSGFGVMALIVGMNRGFISRANGLAQAKKIVTYLEKADRFHGAWPHWSDGTTGKTIAFSPNDNGADIVETSFMIHGLLCLRQYLTPADTVGNNLINRITQLYQAVDWNWFRKTPAENVLYWNWSPTAGFAVNVPARGYNETLITYLLAAGSATHSIPVEVYQQGWAQNKNILNGNSYLGHVLPLGEPYGGPLFFTQYSFLGFDPHVTDTYLNVNYWTQNVNQSLINHDYCVKNPGNYALYSDSCWGITASDNPWGYGAQSPTNDNGTISPTAAISSMPYTPAQSMKAIRFFYYQLGDRLWGQYGFYDAINLTQGWTATSTLAIDQGPIVVMLENYRTGLLWKLFKTAPEVQAAKTKLGFN